MKKTLGVLCHISSIPSKYGVGDFGKASKNFIDLLAKNNIGLWQILPLNKTNEFNCPYSTICSIAFDELFVCPDALLEQKLIDEKDLKNLKKLKKTKKVQYQKVKKEKIKLFDIAFSNLPKDKFAGLEKFVKTNPQIKNYAIFYTLLQTFNVSDWRMLPKEYVEKNSDALKSFATAHKQEIDKQIFIQYVLYGQWKEVLQYAHKKNVKIFGDLPIYPDKKSFEVFWNPNMYKLHHKTLLPAVTGGVPADDFCKDGQDWGTCIYNWKDIEKEDFAYLINKIKFAFSLCDILRLDHFAGYVEHFEVNATNPSKSKWIKEGGDKFFESLSKRIPLKNFVVEDLGIISPECAQVKEKHSLCGMKVLQFALNNNSYLPNNYNSSDYAYLGTHDNAPFVGYLNSLTKKEKAAFLCKLNLNKANNKQTTLSCIKKLLSSNAKIVILQLQDILLQGNDSRMNLPGQVAGCWDYKAPQNTNKIFEKNLKKFL